MLLQMLLEDDLKEEYGTWLELSEEEVVLRFAFGMEPHTCLPLLHPDTFSMLLL